MNWILIANLFVLLINVVLTLGGIAVVAHLVNKVAAPPEPRGATVMQFPRQPEEEE